MRQFCQFVHWSGLWYILLLEHGCGRAQLIVGGATPGLMALSTIRQQTEQVTMKKLGNSCLPPTASALVPALRFLPDFFP